MIYKIYILHAIVQSFRSFREDLIYFKQKETKEKGWKRERGRREWREREREKRVGINEIWETLILRNFSRATAIAMHRTCLLTQKLQRRKIAFLDSSYYFSLFSYRDFSKVCRESSSDPVCIGNTRSNHHGL